MLRASSFHNRHLLSIAVALLLVSCAAPGLSVQRDLSRQDFKLQPSGADSRLGSGELSLHALPADSGTVTCEVLVESARDLKASYFQVSYDAAHYTPLRAAAGSALQTLAGGRLLELCDFSQPGRLSYGQCLANWDRRAGFSGAGLVATLYFAQRPFPAATRSASTPPTSSLSQATLSWDAAHSLLSWRYCNEGDYDQNGEVNISDLTPLGLYFNQSCSWPAEENSAKSCADGDRNGQINISDLTPIGRNLGCSLQWWNIYLCGDVAQYPSSPSAGNGSATLLGPRQLAEHDVTTTPASDRLLFTAGVAAPNPADVYWVRPVDNAGAEGIASNYAPGGGSGNNAPTAVITTSGGGGLSGTAPHQVNFDGLSSFDSDGDPLVSYAWDFENDGIVDATTATAQHIYWGDGSYTAKLTVSDGSLPGEDQVTVNVSPPGSWHVQTLESEFNTGMYCDLKSIGGLAGIAYAKSGGGLNQLRYIFSLNAYGLEGSWYMYVAHPIASPEAVSLCEVQGQPAIAFDECDPGTGGPYYTRYDGAGNWSAVAALDITPGAGAHCSLAVSSGMPLIAYVILGSFDSVWLATSGDASGSVWLSTIQATSATSESYGVSVSLCDCGGIPALSCYNQSNSGLCFAMASDSTPSSFSCSTLWSVPSWFYGTASSITTVHGRPAIALFANTAGPPAENNIYYSRADDAAATSWPVSPDIISSNGSLAVSLALIAGQPAIAWRSLSGELLYKRAATQSDFSSTEGEQLVDAPGTLTGMNYCSLCEINGLPAIAYYDEVNGDLKFAIRY